MNYDHTFSVIIPVYNVQDYLAKCIESVLTQSFVDFELILVDDGSSDESPSICDMYAGKDTRITVIHKGNGGVASARNEGLLIAKGRYIVFLDSDDFWIDKLFLEDLYKIIQDECPDIIIIKAVNYLSSTDSFNEPYVVFKKNDFSSDDYDTRLLELIAASAYRANSWNKVFSHRLVEKGNLLFREGVIAEDVDWAARLLLLAESITILDKPVYGYRIGRQGSITEKLGIRNLLDMKSNIDYCLESLSAANITEARRYAYLSYVAYSYVIWMSEAAIVNHGEKEDIINDIKQKSWLLEYDAIKRVRIVKMANRLLGTRLTMFLLKRHLMHVRMKEKKNGKTANRVHPNI